MNIFIRIKNTILYTYYQKRCFRYHMKALDCACKGDKEQGPRYVKLCADYYNKCKSIVV